MVLLSLHLPNHLACCITLKTSSSALMFVSPSYIRSTNKLYPLPTSLVPLWKVLNVYWLHWLQKLELL